jgi:hypothetical protein
MFDRRKTAALPVNRPSGTPGDPRSTSARADERRKGAKAGLPEDHPIKQVVFIDGEPNLWTTTSLVALGPGTA